MFARLMGLNVISPGKLQQLMQKQPVSVLNVNLAAEVAHGACAGCAASRQLGRRPTRLFDWCREGELNPQDPKVGGF